MSGISFRPWRSTSSVPRCLQGFIELFEELGFDRGRVLRLQLLPFLGLRLAHETEHQRLIEGKRPVIILRAALDIALTLDQLADQMLFEHDLLMGRAGSVFLGSSVHARACFAFGCAATAMSASMASSRRSVVPRLPQVATSI